MAMATSFTTGTLGSGAVELASLTLAMGRSPGIHPDSPDPRPRLSIHSDNGGSPGAELFPLDNPDDIRSLLPSFEDHEFNFTPPPGSSLLPGTTYWVVVTATEANITVSGTNESDEDSRSSTGWSIGDALHFRNLDQPALWQQFEFGQPLRLRVRARVAGADLPATPLTWGYVEEGVDSEGTLHPVLDAPNPRGPHGDWWELRTSPGRKYRVEVMFTDPPAGTDLWDVGGGLTLYEGCCREWHWDHMSDDGRAFIEFSRGPTGQPPYLSVRPESYGEPTPEELDANRHARFKPNVYYGPYTITLEDITHVQRMVSNSHSYAGLTPVTEEPNQTATIGYSAAGDHYSDSPESSFRSAISFTTGPSPSGYGLEYVGVGLFDSVGVSSVNAALHSDDSGKPGDKIFDFERISRITGAYTALRSDRFWVPASANALAANTTYWVVFADIGSGTRYLMHFVFSKHEDPGSAAGWSIGNEDWSIDDIADTPVWSKGSAPLLIDVYASVIRTGNSTEAVDRTAPQLRSAEVDGGTLTLTYDEPLATTAVSASAFTVNVNRKARPLVSAGVGESSVLLFLSTPVKAGDKVTVDYTAPSDEGKVRDPAGNAAASFSGQAVTHGAGRSGRSDDPPPDTTPPAFASAEVVDDRLSMEFDEPLDEDSVPDPSAFFVTAAGELAGPVTTVTVSDATVTLVLATPVAWLEGVTISYQVPDDEQAARLRDPARNAVATFWGKRATNLTPRPLTAEAREVPASHDGTSTVGFELRFTERVEIGDTTLRDHALTVTGGELATAQNLTRGTKMRWRIEITPAGNDSVGVSLPPTTDCAAEGAICTEDGRKLSGGLTLTIPGPGVPEPPPADPNTPATGAPVITGTARVGETLTADTSGISDSDGIDDATFSYQWIATDDDGDTAIA
ncbi:MAG: hypothetical protein F4Y02_08730, partial [Chloroflexi bacterium]|nr:hypothetical protein [Chloroflexota bacterium]